MGSPGSQIRLAEQGSVATGVQGCELDLLADPILYPPCSQGQ